MPLTGESQSRRWRTRMDPEIAGRRSGQHKPGRHATLPPHRPVWDLFSKSRADGASMLRQHFLAATGGTEPGNMSSVIAVHNNVIAEPLLGTKPVFEAAVVLLYFGGVRP